MVTCGACKGKGGDLSGPCSDCLGSGELPAEHDPEPWAYPDGERVAFGWGHNLNWGPFVPPEWEPREGYEQEFQPYMDKHSEEHPNRWMR